MGDFNTNLVNENIRRTSSREGIFRPFILENNRLVDDIVLHRICFCSANDNIRKILWTNIIESSGMNGFLHLLKKDAFTQILDCIAGLEVHNASDSSSSLCTLTHDRSVIAIIHNMLSIHKSVN